MGIQYLNSYIKNNTTHHSINKINLESLYGKTISIDTSIYLYKFLADDSLLENMYIMITLLKKYNITPIFVLDGKSPLEKIELLKKRQSDKYKAEKEYNSIKDSVKLITSFEKREKLYETMHILKKQFVRMRKTEYDKVKDLFNAFGVEYIEADGEADAICANLVIKNKAYACLSEDMDLFVYGCPRVLRYLSLTNNTVILYNLNNILYELKMTLKEFKEISVLSGTDYNNSINNNMNLYKVLKIYNLYKQENVNTDFYSWLDNTNHIDNIYKLYDTYNIFSTKNILFKKKVKKKDSDNKKIKEIMEKEGFIFL